jgi:hypothetical protein
VIYISLALKWILTAEETNAAVGAKKNSLGYFRYITADRVACRNAVEFILLSNWHLEFKCDTRGFY